MRNYANTPVYRQAEALSLGVLAERIGDDKHEEVERIWFGFMAWISDQADRLDGMEEAWNRFNAERKVMWR